MTTTTQRLERAPESIAELAQRGLPTYEFVATAADRLRHAIPFDAHCVRLCDPETSLPNGAVSDFACDLAPTIYRHAYSGREFATLPGMRAGGERVATLSRATGGRPELSGRWRDVLEPLGMTRTLRSGPARRIASGVKSSSTVSTAAMTSAPMRHARSSPCWFRSPPGFGPRSSVSPTVTSIPLPRAPAVFRARRGQPDHRAGPRFRPPGESCWITLHATAMATGETGDRVAVVIQPAHAADPAPLKFASLGLTRGELVAKMDQRLS